MITYIYEDSKHNILLSTNNGLVIIFDKLNKPFDFYNLEFRHISHDSTNNRSLSFGLAYEVKEDIFGNIWIGTIKGLNKISREELEKETSEIKIKQYLKNDNGTSISDNFILSLHPDKNGKLWIGTSQGGLNMLDIKTDEIEYFTMKDGLPDNKIYAILEEERDDVYTSLWCSTNNGITNILYNNETGSKKDILVYNYYMEDGLQSNEFNQYSCYKNDEGIMYFGGVNGFNRFDPKTISTKSNQPTAMITDFKVIGKEKSFIINNDKPIVLSHNENFFYIEFTALDYSYSDRIKYAYKLDGLDNDWIFANNRRFVNYTNLKDGEYTFIVKSSNKLGVWSDEEEKWDKLLIKINPPFWKTPLAYILYSFVLLCLIILIICYIIRRFKKKNLELNKERIEKERQQILNQKLRVIDKIKDEFLANTSHELKTPLNGIIGITESLIDGVCGEISPEVRENLILITQSGRRLYNLVNEILDYSKLKNDKLILNKKPVDIKDLCNIVITTIKPTLKDKEIEIFNLIDEDTPLVMGDENRIEQILFNIIGNAVKFTKEGSIEIKSRVVKREDFNSIKTNNDFLELSISDTGIGIPKDKIKYIFNPFEQLDGSISKEYEGTGLGLSITKKIIEEHNGFIDVDSELSKGSVFKVYFPINNYDKPKKRIPNNDTTIDLANIHIKDLVKDPSELYYKNPNEAPQISEEKTLVKIRHDMINILIVDDEHINRKVLRNQLSIRNYNIIEAVNGIDALNIIDNLKNENNQNNGHISHPIDLVILDIMMPKLSGYEVCKILREEYTISDLPILLLTAKDTVKDKVIGFNSGANDFITKPFNKNELYARVNTLISLKKLNSELKSINNNLENIINQRTKEINLKNKDLEAFSYTISHDLKNQVSNINVSSGFLKRFRKSHLDDKGNSMVNMIYETGKIMANILNGVINLFKTSYITLEYQDINLSHITQDILNSLIERDRNRNVEIEIEPDIIVNGDLNMMYIVLENLLSNAWKFTNKENITKITFGKKKINDHMYVYIKDNGIGFNNCDFDKIFKEFNRLNNNYEGSGIGLATVRRIINKHGGEIFAECLKTKDTTETYFYFRLNKDRISNNTYNFID